VQWHHGANQWCLSEETEYSSNTPLGRPMCYGKASFFSTLSYLKEFIREKYSREPVFPPFQFKIKKEK
jgi:hypothetical protein